MTWSALVLMGLALASPPTVDDLEERVTGAVFAELGGPAFLYSVNGQVLFPTPFGGVGLRAGGAFLPPIPIFGADNSYVALPTALAIRAGHRSWAFEGGVAPTAIWWFDEPGFRFMLAPTVGVDHRAPSGFCFGAHLQINAFPAEPIAWRQPFLSNVDDNLFPWLGVRAGWWF